MPRRPLNLLHSLRTPPPNRLLGAGLFVAGAAGFYGMARLLAVMPWNRTMKRI